MDPVKEYLKAIGAKGGAKEGPTKARGTREYYVALRARTKRNPVKKDVTQAASVEKPT